jgi:hypothetical protein
MKNLSLPKFMDNNLRIKFKLEKLALCAAVVSCLLSSALLRFQSALTVKAADLLNCDQNVSSGFNTASLTKQLFNVTDYGALCDGATDDSAAVQAANDAAGAVSGTVTYPANQTCLVKGVFIKADQVGYANATLKIPDNADLWMFNISSSTPNIRIANLIFDGNRDNQPTPSYTENYAGFNKNSIIQAHSLAKNLVIENNTFKNTQYGAAGVEVQDNGGGTIHKIETVKIQNNKFRDIGTINFEIVNPYSFITVLGTDIYYNGTIIFRDNDGINLGTVTALPGPGGDEEQGEGLIAGGFKCVYILRNKIKNQVRFDYKFGGNNFTLVANNKSTDYHWGFVQTQTAAIDAVGNNQPGGIYVINNDVASHYAPAIAMQFKGSTAATANHTIQPNTYVIGNVITQFGAPTGVIDSVQFPDHGKYENIYMKNNTFFNPYRGAFSLIMPVKDNFQMKKLVIEDNVVRGSHLVTANGLFLGQGSGNPIADLQIKNNATFGTQNVMWAPSINYATNFTLTGNNFYKVNGDQALWFSGATSPLIAAVSGNFIDGTVTGFSTSTTVTVWDNNNCGSPQQCASVE